MFGVHLLRGRVSDGVRLPARQLPAGERGEERIFHFASPRHPQVQICRNLRQVNANRHEFTPCERQPASDRLVEWMID